MSDSDSKGDSKVSSAQLRKIKKPIIERRRRERINESLNQLKTLVLDALNKDESRFSKMEKADILEMTVKHLKSVHQHHTATASISNRYNAGFQECAQEVNRYLKCLGGSLDPDVQNRLMNHLNGVAQKTTPNGNVPIQPATATVQIQTTNIPSATQAMTLPGLPIAALSAQGARIVPVLTSTGNISTVNVGQNAIPITVPAGGVVTILPTEDTTSIAKSGSPPAQSPEGKPNVIPLYVNTGIQLSNSPSSIAHNNSTGSNSSAISSPCVSPAGSSSATSPSNQPLMRKISISPQLAEEAPSPSVHLHLHPHQHQSGPVAMELVNRSHSVISHTQTLLQANLYNQDCHSSHQQQALPINGQHPAFYHAEIVNSKEPVWRPW